MKYQLDHHPHEETIHYSEVNEVALKTLAAKGFSFVMVAGEVHVPRWLLDLMRIQERRGTAGDTIDWELVWQKLHDDVALRTHVHAAIYSALKEHNLTQEHAEDVIISYLRALTRGEPLPVVDFKKLRKGYEKELEEQKAKELEDLKHHEALVEEQTLGAKKYSELEMERIVAHAVKSALSKQK
jgi:hypothetical protein